MLVNGEAGDENGQVKIDAREAGEAKRHTQQVQVLHGEVYDGVKRLKELQRYKEHRFNLVTFVTFLTWLIITAMLDIRLIREQPDFMKSRLATRGGEDAGKIDEVLRVDGERRKAETSLQQGNADRKRLSKEIGGKRAKGESTEEIEARVREIGNEITRLNEAATAFDEQQRELLLGIPNLPHANAPVGKVAADNPVVRSWGEKSELKDALDHVALGTKRKLFDLERAAKLSGSGFICF